MKLGFAVGKQHNLDAAVLLFVDVRALHLNGATMRSCVLYGDWAASADLDAMMKNPVGGQRIRSKTGAGIVDLKQSYRAAGVILDGRFDVIGVAGLMGIKKPDRHPLIPIRQHPSPTADKPLKRCGRRGSFLVPAFDGVVRRR